MQDKRAPFQVLVFPFRKVNSEIQYCLFKRADLGVWQGIAGGGEIGETYLQAAMRETIEEAGLNCKEFIILQSMCYMPSIAVRKKFLEENILVIPEYSFGVNAKLDNITISHEHLDYRWVSYEEANKMLHWDSSKTALWELHYRITNNNYPI